MTDEPQAPAPSTPDAPAPARARANRVLGLLAATAALLLVLDLVLERKAEFAWEGTPGFYALLGFLGAIALVLAAKAFRTLVMRDERYYQDAPATAHQDAEHD